MHTAAALGWACESSQEDSRRHILTKVSDVKFWSIECSRSQFVLQVMTSCMSATSQANWHLHHYICIIRLAVHAYVVTA